MTGRKGCKNCLDCICYVCKKVTLKPQRWTITTFVKKSIWLIVISVLVIKIRHEHHTKSIIFVTQIYVSGQWARDRWFLHYHVKHFWTTCFMLLWRNTLYKPFFRGEHVIRSRRGLFRQFWIKSRWFEYEVIVMFWLGGVKQSHLWI